MYFLLWKKSVNCIENDGELCGGLGHEISGVGTPKRSSRNWSAVGDIDGKNLSQEIIPLCGK